jgi:hypothetical protein
MFTITDPEKPIKCYVCGKEWSKESGDEFVLICDAKTEIWCKECIKRNNPPDTKQLIKLCCECEPHRR